MKPNFCPGRTLPLNNNDLLRLISLIKIHRLIQHYQGNYCEPYYRRSLPLILYPSPRISHVSLKCNNPKKPYLPGYLMVKEPGMPSKAI